MASDEATEVGPAVPADIDGILEVQEENQPEHGGSLSARFPRTWFDRAIAEGWLVVARVHGRVAGYVAFTPQAAQLEVPVIRAMLAAHPEPAAYLHGPICVGRAYRRRGLAGAMFRAQREIMRGAPVLAFIREDNEASRRAHAGLGMHEAGTFEHGGVRFVVVAA